MKRIKTLLQWKRIRAIPSHNNRQMAQILTRRLRSPIYMPRVYSVTAHLLIHTTRYQGIASATQNKIGYIYTFTPAAVQNV
jgi:hypothetical protein